MRNSDARKKRRHPLDEYKKTNRPVFLHRPVCCMGRGFSRMRPAEGVIG